MSLSRSNGWLDYYINKRDGEAYYPEFSRERLAAVETLLAQARIRLNLVMGALVHDPRHIFPSDRNERPEGPLRDHEICLLIARLRANDVDYHRVLTALIPDYRTKVETLTGRKDGELDFYPFCLSGKYKGETWMAKSNVVFSHVTPLSPLNLRVAMNRVYCRPPQHEPTLGITEMQNFLDYYGPKLKLPIFALSHKKTEKRHNNPILQLLLGLLGEKENQVWQVLSNEGNLIQREESSKKKAPAGTHFMAVCTQDFFEAPPAR